jgi:hypothetical protein
MHTNSIQSTILLSSLNSVLKLREKQLHDVQQGMLTVNRVNIVTSINDYPFSLTRKLTTAPTANTIFYIPDRSVLLHRIPYSIPATLSIVIDEEGFESVQGTDLPIEFHPDSKDTTIVVGKFTFHFRSVEDGLHRTTLLLEQVDSIQPPTFQCTTSAATVKSKRKKNNKTNSKIDTTERQTTTAAIRPISPDRKNVPKKRTISSILEEKNSIQSSDPPKRKSKKSKLTAQTAPPPPPAELAPTTREDVGLQSFVSRVKNIESESF